MLKSVEGVFSEGKIELSETPTDIPDNTKVIVTFLNLNGIDLRERDMDEAHAADLRARLVAFAEEWESPDMDMYDDYNTTKP